MKEATGELNMTVVTIILAAMILAFFYTWLWPNIKGNLNTTSNCNAAVCSKTQGTGDKKGYVECYNPKDAETRDNPFYCIWKG